MANTSRSSGDASRLEDLNITRNLLVPRGCIQLVLSMEGKHHSKWSEQVQSEMIRTRVSDRDCDSTFVGEVMAEKVPWRKRWHLEMAGNHVTGLASALIPQYFSIRSSSPSFASILCSYCRHSYQDHRQSWTIFIVLGEFVTFTKDYLSRTRYCRHGHSSQWNWYIQDEWCIRWYNDLLLRKRRIPVRWWRKTKPL